MLKKRSFTIARHRTSVALEPEFWAALERIAAARGLSLARLVAEVDAERAREKRGLLASALRVHALAAAAGQKMGRAARSQCGPSQGRTPSPRCARRRRLAANL